MTKLSAPTPIKRPAIADSIIPETLDYSPLTSRKVFDRANKEVIDAQAGLFLVDLIVVVIAVIGALMDDETTSPPEEKLAGGVIVGIPIAAIIHVYMTIRAYQQSIIRQFALANKLTPIFDSGISSQPGSVFQRGHSKTFTTGLTSRGAGWLIGNYEYSIGSGRSESTYSYGICVANLSRTLPNIIIDSRERKGFLAHNLPFSFDASQRIKLEGNFDKYFTVYAPKEYETDLLYILTPELMAHLVDYGRGYDFEIVENKLYIYRGPFAFRPKKLRQTMQSMLPIARFFQYQFLDNTYRYRDEQILVSADKPTAVAERGRRLIRKERFLIPHILLILGALVGLSILIPIIEAIFDIIFWYL